VQELVRKARNLKWYHLGDDAKHLLLLEVTVSASEDENKAQKS